jgi:hypothetical protein
VTTDPEKQEAVQRCPPPRDKYDRKSLLGSCTDYTRFVVGFTDITKPLTQLAEEKRTCQWSPEANTAFRFLKEALCTASVGECPRPGEIVKQVALGFKELRLSV